MPTLYIAAKANQAITVPVLLIASYANESDPNASIDLRFEEAETLESKDGATVELVVANDSPFRGFEQAITGLTAVYPFLQGKHEPLVSDVSLKCLKSRSLLCFRSKNG